MQFLFPSFLWALLALSIPVIIHLFHFRRFKRVYFTNVHLLKEIKEETSSRSKIRNLLVLLARMLAFAMLVLAFAQPVIRNEEGGDADNRLVTVFVDNSFSMNATKDEVPLLRLAKDKATDIIRSYDETDRFLILSHDLESKHQRLVDQKTALNFVEEINSTPEVHSISEIMRVAERIEQTGSGLDRRSFIISDFQASISQTDAPRDSTVEINLIPIRSVQENNVALESCFFEAPIAVPNETNSLIVQVSNYGEQENEVQMSLYFENQERPQGVVSLGPNSTIFDTIQLPVNRVGWHEFEIRIDDYPVEFDDVLYGSFEIKDRVEILSIYESESNSYLTSAFQSIDYYNLTQVDSRSVRYDQFDDLELIVLDDLPDLSSGLIAELTTYVDNGGNLLVFPGTNANVQAYNSLFDRLRVDRFNTGVKATLLVSGLNSSEFIFKDVFVDASRQIRLPSASFHYPVEDIQSRPSDVLLRFRNGNPYLYKHTFGRGNIYVCTSPLSIDQSDLVRNAEIFVPMLYKMALSSGIRQALYYVIGRDDVIPFESSLPASNGNYMMSGAVEFIPGVRIQNQNVFLEVRDQISESGFYKLKRENTSLASFAFNYDRQESDVRMANMDDLATGIGQNVRIIDEIALADLSGFIQEKHEGFRLWRWCIFMALVFLLIETLLLRFWK